MKRIDLSHHSTLMILSVVAIFLAVAGPARALDTEQTILVPPYLESISIDIGPNRLVTSTYGPFHGTLTPVGNDLIYQPSASIKEAKSDLALVSIVSGSGGFFFAPYVLRLRFVAGDTALDGGVITMGDITGAPASWTNWTISGDYTVVGGLLVNKAYALNFASTNTPGHVRAPTDDGTASGQGHTTSTTTVDIEVRDIPTILPSDPRATEFFRILEGTDPAVELAASWDQIAENWTIHLTSEVSSSASNVDLPTGPSRLTIRRWTGRYGTAGADLFLNDKPVTTIAAAPLAAETVETYEFQLEGIEGPPGTELVVENPFVARSPTLVDPTTRLIYDPFTGGADPQWAVAHAGAQAISAQDLPGNGDRFDVDFGYLSPGAHSFLETAIPLQPGGVVDPPGFAMRFWMDPTAVTLAPNTGVRIATACTETGSCGAARIWLKHDGNGLAIEATAWQNGQSAARIETPITNQPHLIELRMRHGWKPTIANGSLELWIDGVLIGDVAGLNNHTSQINKLRLGVLNDPAGSSGVIGFDEYEAWRFD